MRRLIGIAALLLAGTCGGCGSADPAKASATPATARIDSLPGKQVGRLAEEQLEAEHLEMATGTVTCPDLPWKVDASVRCVKVSELSDGRRVIVPGTVTVTSTKGGGKLHVELDDDVAEFGVDQGQLSDDVAAWVAVRTHQTPSTVRCPYLRGVRGTVARCAVMMSGERARVVVRVTDVDPQEFRTRYALSWQRVPAAVASKACLRCG